MGHEQSGGDGRELRTEVPVSDAGGPPTAEAFSLLSDETRLEIIRAIGNTGPEGDPLAFSELRERVGLRDSGQFNYHLDKLTGKFVREKDDDDDEGEGYGLTYAGVLVYQALVRGTFDQRFEVETFDTGIDCHECDGTYEASYDPTSLFTLECPDCESRLYYAHFPPRGVENRTREEFLAAADQWIRKDVAVFTRGLCPYCSGDVETTLVTATEEEADDDHQFPTDERPMVAYVRYNCQRCQAQIFSTVGMHLVTHPAVMGFFEDHGVDLRTRPLWDIEFAASSGYARLQAEDPPRVAITVEAGDDHLELVVDETASVVERDRT
jgi:DNA-binding transcriptional ArsR family regulator